MERKEALKEKRRGERGEAKKMMKGTKERIKER